LPSDFAGHQIEAEKLAFGGGVKVIILEDHVHEIFTFQLLPPHLAPGGAIESDHSSFDANEYQVGLGHLCSCRPTW
jgi:hypothetical protein